MSTPLEPEIGVETVADQDLDDGAAVVTRRPGAARQRPLAAIVVVAAVLVVLGITAGPWARTTFSAGGEDAELNVDLDPSGRVHVRDGDPGLVEQYNSDDNEIRRTVLEEAIPGTSSELARILAVLVAVIASVGLMRDLTTHSWVLVASLALGCLVLVVIHRDQVTSTLATNAVAMELGDERTRPTFWGALAVGASAAAALAAGFAAAPRPAETTQVLPEAPTGRQRGDGRSRRRFGWKARAPRNTF